MGLSALQYLIMTAVIVLVFATDMLVGKRNRDRHGAGNGAKDRKIVEEDTCVNGYCISPSYNKLELPSSKPSHVRINLEVGIQYKNTFSISYYRSTKFINVQ